MSAVSLLRSRRSIWFKRWVIVTMIAIVVVNPGSRTQRVHAQSPAGAGFVLDAGDLRFIFHQIEIAEAHSAGGQLFGPGPLQVPEIRLPFGLRTVDGSFNHLETGFVDTTKFGAADQTFPRLTTPTFRQAETLTFDDGPGGVDVGEQTSYDQRNGAVVDSQPRVISNLIVDQRATSNPAVAALVSDPLSGNEVIDPVTGLAFIPNVAPDVGLSAPFNVMFTFFGQFFDHGLDLVNKGGNGIVFVPLNADDPLVLGADGIPGTADDLPPSLRFMVLTRGTMLPGPDNIQGTEDDIHEGTNQTSPFVDQNQTYTSHPSHQVFLREYVLAGGRPVSNGKMIDGVGGHIGNWGEIKQQAAQMLGIALSDLDVFNVPLLETDLYGYF